MTPIPNYAEFLGSLKVGDRVRVTSESVVPNGEGTVVKITPLLVCYTVDGCWWKVRKNGKGLGRNPDNPTTLLQPMNH